MKICILMGSPRKHGNTQALLEPFSAELQNKNIDYETIWLYDKKLPLAQPVVPAQIAWCKKIMPAQSFPSFYQFCCCSHLIK